MTMDQASGLRHWASRQERDAGGCPTHVAEALIALVGQVPAASRVAVARRPPPAAQLPASTATLLIVGLPARQLERAREPLTHWHGQGRRWVGDPQRWQLVSVAPDSPHLPLLAAQQPRWALWVEADAESFRRAWRLLLALAEGGGPGRLLLLHPPGIRRPGLLDNLQQAAAHYLGVELVVLA